MAKVSKSALSRCWILIRLSYASPAEYHTFLVPRYNYINEKKGINMGKAYKLVLILILLLFSGLSNHSQTPIERHLEPASVDEFIASLPFIIEVVGAGDAIDVLEREFWLRYADDASFEQVGAIYEELNQGVNAYAHYSPYLDIERWHLAMLERYLTESPTELSSVEAFDFGDYSVIVQELLVSNPNQPDWLLSLDYPGFHHTWLARLNHDSSTGYDLTSMPFAYYEQNFWWSQPEGGGPLTPIIEDVTGDGLVDFIVTDWQPAPASWTSASFHSYQIASWTGETLEIILYTSILDNDPTPWTHENIDDDPELEMIQRVIYEDNYGCTRQSVTIFDLLNGNYIRGDEVSTFDDTINCDLHQAEKAYQEQDILTAIAFYLIARERYVNLSEGIAQDQATSYFMYATEKLIVSYALTNQIDEAISLIDELNQYPQADDTIAHALGQITDDDTTAVEICRTARETMVDYRTTDWRSNYRNIPQVGYVNEAFYGENHPFGTSEDGCDMPLLLLTIINTQTFSLSPSPLVQLEEIGFSISDTSVYDINEDGQDDWILWFEHIYPARLFLSQDESYTVVTFD